MTKLIKTISLLLITGSMLISMRASVPASDVTMEKPPIGSAATTFGTITGYGMNDSQIAAGAERLPLFRPYNRNDDAWWSNLIEEATYARIHVLFFVNRGPEHLALGEINSDPIYLTRFASAATRANARDLIKAACFVESSAIGILYQDYKREQGLNVEARFDVADGQAWYDVMWDKVINRFFNTLKNDQDLWYRYAPPGWSATRPVIFMYSLGDTFYKNQNNNAYNMLNVISDKMQATYGVRPLFHLDQDWLQKCPSVAYRNDLISFNNWFNPPSTSYSFRASTNNAYPSWSGKNWGLMVPEFKDRNNPSKTIARNNGTTLLNGLNQSVSQNAEFVILEGFANWEENAGYYRSKSTGWLYPSQYLNLVRNYADRRTQTLRYQAEACDEFYPIVAGSHPFRTDGLNTQTINASGEWSVLSPVGGSWVQFNEVKLSHGHYRFSARAMANAGGKSVRVVISGTSGPWVAVPVGNFDTISLGEFFLDGANNFRFEYSADGVQLDWAFSKKIDQRVALSASNGQYLSADFGGGTIMSANRSGVGDWEAFNLVDEGSGNLQSGDTVTLQSYTGKWAVADNGGGSTLSINRDGIGVWERFVILKLSGGDNIIRSGDTIALRSANNYYMRATNGGGSSVTFNSPNIGTSERFVIRFQ